MVLEGQLVKIRVLGANGSGEPVLNGDVGQDLRRGRGRRDKERPGRRVSDSESAGRDLRCGCELRLLLVLGRRRADTTTSRRILTTFDARRQVPMVVGAQARRDDGRFPITIK